MTNEKRNPFVQKVIIVSIILGFLIPMGTLLISWSNERGKRLLLEDQVKRNTLVLTNYDLRLIDYRLNEIDAKLEQVIELLISD